MATVIYRKTRDPNVVYNETAGVWFPLDDKKNLATIAYNQDIASGDGVLLEMIVATVEDKRKAAYSLAGVSTDRMVVAMWESLIEKRPEAAQEIQAIRAQVKATLPKT